MGLPSEVDVNMDNFIAFAEQFSSAGTGSDDEFRRQMQAIISTGVDGRTIAGVPAAERDGSMPTHSIYVTLVNEDGTPVEQ